MELQVSAIASRHVLYQCSQKEWQPRARAKARAKQRPKKRQQDRRLCRLGIVGYSEFPPFLGAWATRIKFSSLSWDGLSSWLILWPRSSAEKKLNDAKSSKLRSAESFQHKKTRMWPGLQAPRRCSSSIQKFQVASSRIMLQAGGRPACCRPNSSTGVWGRLWFRLRGQRNQSTTQIQS